jgi:hypothetical protein
MQFEEQTAAMRQMKELLRDQAKFRAKLDRVVRKIETSSERTAKLAERNKARVQKQGNGHSTKQQQHQPQAEGLDGDAEPLEHEAATSGQAV